METALWLYLLTRLDGIIVLFLLAAIISILLFIGGVIARAESYEEDKKKYDKPLRLLFGASILFSLLIVLIPTQKDAMIIAAGVGVVEAAKTETAQRIAGKSVQVIESYLDKALEKDIKKEK